MRARYFTDHVKRIHLDRLQFVPTANGRCSWLKLRSAALFQSSEQLNRHVRPIWPLLGGNFPAMYFNIFACIAEPACLSASLPACSGCLCCEQAGIGPGAWMQSPPISHCWHPHVMVCQISASLLLFREAEELCCWHQPALSKAACVKECVCVYCWDTFIITFSFPLPHTGGFCVMCPEGFHMQRWIQMWTNTGPAAQIYKHTYTHPKILSDSRSPTTPKAF